MASGINPLFQGPGNNQYGNYGTSMPGVSNTLVLANPNGGVQSVAAPASSSTTPPGIVPVPPNTASPQNPYSPYPYNPAQGAGQLGGIIDQPGTGANTESTLYPNYTNEFYNWLSGQIGTGVQPFNLSTVLPSSGQATQPGQVNAPLTGLLQQLQQFYSTGTGGPAGSGTLQSMAQTGNPTDVGPAWQSMVASENQNTAQNEAQIREQFASLGNLNGSPFGTALTNFGEQNTLNQNAQLTAAQQAAQEAAAGRQLSASTELTSGANTLGTTLQGVDQSAIQNLITQYNAAQPQNNPLNSILYGTANTFAPFFTQGSGGILAGLIPGLAGAGAGAGTAAASGGGIGDILLGALAGL